MSHLILVFILWLRNFANAVVGISTIQEKLFDEFSGCKITLIEGTQDYFSSYLRKSGLLNPVVRLSVHSLPAPLQKFNETRFNHRQNCELLLGSHDGTAEIIQSVHEFFQFHLACTNVVEMPYSAIPLCYAEYTFYVLLQPLRRPHWRGKVLE